MRDILAFLKPEIAIWSSLVLGNILQAMYTERQALWSFALCKSLHFAAPVGNRAFSSFSACITLFMGSLLLVFMGRVGPRDLTHLHFAVLVLLYGWLNTEGPCFCLVGVVGLGGWVCVWVWVGDSGHPQPPFRPAAGCPTGVGRCAAGELGWCGMRGSGEGRGEMAGDNDGWWVVMAGKNGVSEKHQTIVEPGW